MLIKPKRTEGVVLTKKYKNVCCEHCLVLCSSLFSMLNALMNTKQTLLKAVGVALHVFNVNLNTYWMWL